MYHRIIQSTLHRHRRRGWNNEKAGNPCNESWYFINHLNLYECMSGGICCVILTKCITDYALTKKTAAHTTQYYKAVNKVQEQLAQKNTELEKQWAQKKTAKQKEIGQKGTAQKTVKQKTVILSEINIIESVSKRQQLVVTLHLDKTGTVPQYYIKKWQLCSPEDWQADESLDVMKSIE